MQAHLPAQVTFEQFLPSALDCSNGLAEQTNTAADFRFRANKTFSALSLASETTKLGQVRSFVFLRALAAHIRSHKKKVIERSD